LTLAAATAMAQSNNIPQVQHVIVIVQENRTPTNLFQQDSTLINRGAHIVSQSAAPDVCAGTAITLQPTPLYTCWDPYHSHASWTSMWHNGGMNGACNIQMDCNNGTCPNGCTDGNLCYDYPGSGFKYCSYTYVENTTFQGTYPYDRILHPYFQIAETYGFANYMFQANQGPSFPAHQFLFSGTSAPISYSSSGVPICYYNTSEKYSCYQWFDGENISGTGAGCIAQYGAYALDIDPKSNETTAYTPTYVPGGANAGFPCYSHNSLPTLLGNNIGWVYYARLASHIWTAPTAINDICDTSGAGGSCNPNGLWQQHVGNFLPDQNNYDSAPILDDIENCKLPQVSWVIPDGNRSDHADNGLSYGDGGPSWVAAIVNAVGNSGYNGCTDTVNGQQVSYWDDTVILVTWDDWGGYYDDVVPPDCPGPNQCSGYANGTGGQYVYGFRVPLLVVSAYAKQAYISGTNVGSQPNCAQVTCHDFGSILNFIEYAFGLPQGGIGNPNWPYADYFALDYNPSVQGSYSLSDFFNFGGNPNSFSNILGAKYPEKCFHVPNQTGCFPGTYPMDPDNDANE